MTPILSAENITKDYVNENVLKGVSVQFYENSFTAILGQSGSGKTTLLNILSGLTKPTSGQVILDGINITQASEKELSKIKRCKIGYIFQNYLLLSNLNVEENIRIGAPDSTDIIGLDRVTEILGIKDLYKKFPSELSGGQQQRVAIARAVVKKPQILFCDEATGALDEENSKKVVELLHTVKNTFGISIIFVTHNLSIANTADRIITLKNGKIESDIENENPIQATDMKW